VQENGVVSPSTRAALLRYRVVAYVVGVVLIVLVFVAMPLKYLADDSTLVEVVGPVHGFLYMVYLVVGLDLGVRTRMKPLPILLVLLAGTVPFLSFVAERRVTRWVRGRPAPAEAAVG
jgi:integral membrane protein